MFPFKRLRRRSASDESTEGKGKPSKGEAKGTTKSPTQQAMEQLELAAEAEGSLGRAGGIYCGRHQIVGTSRTIRIDYWEDKNYHGVWTKKIARVGALRPNEVLYAPTSVLTALMAYLKEAASPVTFPHCPKCGERSFTLLVDDAADMCALCKRNERRSTPEGRREERSRREVEERRLQRAAVLGRRVTVRKERQSEWYRRKDEVTQEVNAKFPDSDLPGEIQALVQISLYGERELSKEEEARLKRALAPGGKELRRRLKTERERLDKEWAAQEQQWLEDDGTE